MWTKVQQFWENRDQSSKFDRSITFLFLNLNPQNFGGLGPFPKAVQKHQNMWTKVHQFRENQNHHQNLTPHNFFVFVLWPTIFGCLVFLLEGFPTMPKYVDQSSQVLRKSGPKFKIRSLNNFFVSEPWPKKFDSKTILDPTSKCAKFYVKTPNRFRDMRHFSSLISIKLKLSMS